jgi:hypothetical protein
VEEGGASRSHLRGLQSERCEQPKTVDRYAEDDHEDNRLNLTLNGTRTR